MGGWVGGAIGSQEDPTERELVLEGIEGSPLNEGLKQMASLFSQVSCALMGV